MFLVLQLPIVDLRGFTDRGRSRLTRPTWPSANAGEEFLRSLGGIRLRPRGGLNGWVAEHVFCEIRRGFKTDSDLGRVAFQRFYFDGWAVGKLEVGVRISSENNVRRLVDRALRLTTTVDFPDRNSRTTVPLVEAGVPFAKKYALATTSHSADPNRSLDLVSARNPAVFLEASRSELFRDQSASRPPPHARGVPIWSAEGVQLIHWWHNHVGKPIRIWALVFDEEPFSYRHGTFNGRDLRVFLLRLHAEHEALQHVLRRVDSGEIAPSPGSNESDSLQLYLNEATRRISILNRDSTNITGSDIAGMALSSMDRAEPGFKDALLSRLVQVGARRNIIRKISLYGEQWEEASGPTRREIIMGDKYEISGQAGVVGPHTKIENQTLQQRWDQTGLDVKSLAKELQHLHQEATSEATTTEEELEAELIGKAAEAAHNGDGAKATGFLSKTGRWAFGIAEKIGVSVAAAAIKHSLGL